MELVFKVRWWDYSNQPFNYNGRVCLKNSMCFGIAGLGVMYFLYPIVNNIIHLLPIFWLELIAVILFIIFMIDLVFTTTTLFNVKSNLEKVEEKDVTVQAHEEIMQAIKKYDFSLTRLLKAFPHIENVNIKEFGIFKDAVMKYHFRNKLAENTVNNEEQS